MGSPGEIQDTLLDVRSFREELQQRNAFSRGKNEVNNALKDLLRIKNIATINDKGRAEDPRQH